jgi:pyruvate-formate lyase-activating enzyme
LIHFYKNTIRSYKDLPNKVSLIFHSINCSCNLKCFGCFNYKTIVQGDKSDYLNEEQVLDIINKTGYMYDVIIFSGGEFLLHDITEIEALLVKIKEIYNGSIVIYTNGILFNKIKYLTYKKLIDGFHIDMKLPYHLLEPDLQEDQELMKAILGRVLNHEEISNILNSINLVIRENSPYSQIRTVRYPILPNEVFDEIKARIDCSNIVHGSNVPYYLNEYIDID